MMVYYISAFFDPHKQLVSQKKMKKKTIFKMSWLRTPQVTLAFFTYVSYR